MSLQHPYTNVPICTHLSLMYPSTHSIAMLSAIPLDHVGTDSDGFSCAHSTNSAAQTSCTAITSPSLSLRRSQSGDDIALRNHERPDCTLSDSITNTLMSRTPSVYSGVYKQDDIVGQYLAQRAALADSMGASKASELNYANTSAGHHLQGFQAKGQYDSYPVRQPPSRWYPDPDKIRHLHTLHSLLPHIQPERKLNALSGLELDIIEGNTGGIICRAVPKKMLVLFLGREVVNKFIHTLQREPNGTWRGPPTHQVMILPNRVASPVALRILISWMIRACTFATMHEMKQIRLPANLFAACSLAQTMELLGLHRDSYRIDIAISQQSLKRPVYATEVETLWRCLNETNKYVYACIKTISSQQRTPRMKKEIEELVDRCPELYARICDPCLNEDYQPQFGRGWFQRLGDGMAVQEHQNESPYSDKSSLRRHSEVIEPATVSMRSLSGLNPTAPSFKPSNTT